MEISSPTSGAPGTSHRSTVRGIAFTASGVLCLLLIRWQSGTFRWSFEDLAVYRHAGAAIVHGISPYATKNVLPFTYPPFAAVLFAPLHLIGATAAGIALCLLSIASLACIVTVCGQQLRLTRHQTMTTGLLCLTLEPVLRTFRLGQVNLVLMALVLLDCFVVPPRLRGLLTGVATGMKLTPAIFLGWFLIRRDWRAATLTAGGGVCTVLISGLASPASTWEFWTRLWFDPAHVGGVAYVDNQSLFGVLVRLLRNEHPPGPLVLTVDLLTLALGSVAARRQLQSGQTLAAATAVGMTGLLVSPISWSHHWVWMIPALLVLRWRRMWFGLSLGICIGYLALQWTTPSGNLSEFHATWYQQVLCASFPLWGLLFLAHMLTQPSGPTEPGPNFATSGRQTRLETVYLTSICPAVGRVAAVIRSRRDDARL